MRETRQEHRTLFGSKQSVKGFGMCCAMLPPATRGEWYFLLFYPAFLVAFSLFCFKSQKTFKNSISCFSSSASLGWKEMMGMLFMDKCKAGWRHSNVWWNRLKSFSTLDSAAWWNTEVKYKNSFKKKQNKKKTAELLCCCFFVFFLHIHLFELTDSTQIINIWIYNRCSRYIKTPCINP